MPTGPRGEKRPADLIGCAVQVMKIATGEDSDKCAQQQIGKKRSGHAGGIARKESLTSSKRTEIAKFAANARWR